MIDFEKVTKEFDKKPKKIIALKNVTFHIKPKEFVSIVGPSGAGKSTVVRLLTKEETPSLGTIKIGGINLGNLKKRDVPFFRRKIGVVFQDFKLLSQKTVFENVTFPLEVASVRGKEIQRRVSKVLQMVGLLDRVRNFPDELSGGEIQRVSIARAIVEQPKVLIADEPTGNLDPKTAWEIVELLLKINQFGTTIILTSHNKEIVNAIRKRVITLSKGEIVRDQQVGKYSL